MRALKKYIPQIIVSLVVALLVFAVSCLVPLVGRWFDRFPNNIVRIQLLLAVSGGALVAIFAFAFLYVARRHREPSRIEYWLTGVFSIIAAGVLCSVMLLLAQIWTSDHSIQLVADERRVALWCHDYRTNGTVTFKEEQGESGENWLWIASRWIDPLVEDTQSIVPFDCGVMLKCSFDRTFDIAAYKHMEFEIRLETSDSIDEVYIGLADRRPRGSSVEVKYCLANFVNPGGGPRDYFIKIPLAKFEEVNRRKVAMIVFSTNSEIIGEDRRVAFGLKEIRVEK